MSRLLLLVLIVFTIIGIGWLIIIYAVSQLALDDSRVMITQQLRTDGIVLSANEISLINGVFQDRRSSAVLGPFPRCSSSFCGWSWESLYSEG